MSRQPPSSGLSGLSAADRLIVALDVPDLAAAAVLVGRLRPAVSWFKIGSQLFTAAGPAAVALVHDAGGRVFLDLKFHDIPTTVAGAVAVAAGLGVAMVNVHTAGGEAMLRAAVAACAAAAPAGSRAPGWTRPVLIGVTLLTSDPDTGDLVHRAVSAAEVARSCGLDGVVCSPRECAAIKDRCGRGFVVVTPGIRLPPSAAGAVTDDQRRTATPAEAVRAGADFLVVGRPIVRARDPLAAAAAVIAEIEAALAGSVPSASRFAC
ncbi:MAG: orotidine-5'-phosphate decarboxylase [Armatimonadota bacterium]|nr:orotidine-5'-phosphate decarboxylase [Armatimonadota bacterium]MDR7452051.1 orotidine-5'-phosphate decarboxylase [Armatimonadota bacterium]MDR7466513.1 orotidine-5'-phosphate decarboxylase [Armatimonadota bacterium]MDR7493235.1 orotidine-5'-phosphate decarboxylase [Armatimonadota bacterium]MDR7504709.1 orotidine-5'-phosphate decarboxylase [Armatimonadota bacterium]